jgi:hypothetical protein
MLFLMTKRANVGSPFPIDGGASTRILWRRDFYGGRKGRRARLRLRALERRIARTGVVRAMFEGDFARMQQLLAGVTFAAARVQQVYVGDAAATFRGLLGP